MFDKTQWQRAWRLKHPDRLRIYRKRYAAKHAALDRKWRAKNKEKLRARRKEVTLRQRYNLSLEQYVQLIQGGCAICGVHSGALHVDHDHKTQRVRGVLCQNCNFGLGMFKDKQELLHKAIDYLNDASQA